MIGLGQDLNHSEFVPLAKLSPLVKLSKFQRSVIQTLWTATVMTARDMTQRAGAIMKIRNILSHGELTMIPRSKSIKLDLIVHSVDAQRLTSRR